MLLYSFFIPLFFTKEKVFSLEISGGKSRVFFHSEFLGRDISYPNKKKEKKDTRSRGEVNIPWRWKILSPNLFVYIECVVSIPRMIRTRIFVSDLGRRYSGVPARACSLYQEIYIYIYTNRKSITSSFQETEKEIEGSGRGGVDFSNREISRI